MPAHERLGLNDRQSVQDRWKPPIQVDEEPAIAIRQPDSATHIAPQYDQLVPERRILCFKPDLRLKRRSQQPDHRVSLGDSSLPSMWIRFLVHTGILRARSPVMSFTGSRAATSRCSPTW